MLSNKEFFNSASDYYDEMVDFPKSLENKKSALKKFIKENYESAGDLGCGTGLDSIALSQLGLTVTAFDLSPEMIEKAKRNAAEFDVKINFNAVSLDEIVTDDEQFSFVVSLGNTLANINKHSLRKTIFKIHSMLKKDGYALIQILNFNYILEKSERIINITKRNGKFFIRFYDFQEENIDFNILKFEENDPTERELITTTLYPHLPEEMLQLFEEADFSEINLYGNFNKTEFIADSSKDLIIYAKK